MRTIKVSRKEIKPQEILYLESWGNYTMFYLRNNKKALSSFTLQIFEERLKDFHFYRVNRSQIINFSAVKILNYDPSQTSILLDNGQEFLVSRRRRKQLSQYV